MLAPTEVLDVVLADGDSVVEFIDVSVALESGVN